MPMPYEYQPYPKVLYHETLAPVTVEHADAHAEYGDDWQESPVEALAVTGDGAAPKATKGRKPKASDLPVSE